MIRIAYETDGAGHELSIEGHAGYAEEGHDVVCAGVSALAQALLGWIYKYDQHIRQIDGPVIHKGHLWVRCEGNKHIKSAFQMAMVGFEQIAGAYPAYVEVQYTGTDR